MINVGLCRLLPLYIRALLMCAVALVLGACSGIDVTADATDTFLAKNYSSYAWRSDPPSKTISSKDKLPLKSPTIRSSFESKMTDLGYQSVSRADAEFLVEYLAGSSYNDGQLLHGGSNEMLYGSSVNREIDGASADNARQLSGIVETGEIVLMFVDANTSELLWKTQMSIVVEDTNRIDEDEVRKAVVKGLSKLPPAS